MNRRNGLLLVLGLLVVSLSLMGLMKWMELRTQATGTVGETALLAEAQRRLGPSVSQLDTLPDLTGDGAPERIGVLSAEGSTGGVQALVVLTIARKKVRTLLVLTAAGVLDGEGKPIVAAEVAAAYQYSVVPCPKGSPMLQLVQLDEAGQPASDPLYLFFDTERKAFVPRDGC